MSSPMMKTMFGFFPFFWASWVLASAFGLARARSWPLFTSSQHAGPAPPPDSPGCTLAGPLAGAAASACWNGLSRPDAAR
jgi:hypothetical protein